MIIALQLEFEWVPNQIHPHFRTWKLFAANKMISGSKILLRADSSGLKLARFFILSVGFVSTVDGPQAGTKRQDCFLFGQGYEIVVHIFKNIFFYCQLVSTVLGVSLLVIFRGQEVFKHIYCFERVSNRFKIRSFQKVTKSNKK